MGHGTSSSMGMKTKAALGALSLCLFLLLALAASAQAASFEQVGCFAGSFPGLTESCKPVKEEKFGEEVQLGGLGGMAVNYTGAGGVPKGTVYAIGETNLSSFKAVVMFAPSAEGLRFEEAWQVTGSGGPYNRCGPLLGVDGEGKAKVPCQTRVEAQARPMDVDVDEATGNVYVYNQTSVAGQKAIIAYTADGSEELTRFGEVAPFSETIAESPEKTHLGGIPGMLAIGAGGEVFVFDQDNLASGRRLMKFKPKVAGKYDEYEYAAGEDVGTASAHRPTQPVADAAGNVYVASQASFIEAYDPANPAAPPICSFKYTPGGITAMTVDPLGGSVFFFGFKAPKRVHELGPCNPATHKFEGPKGEEEVGQIALAPERDDFGAMALDPTREIEAGRPVGALYGAAPGSVPGSGVGKGEPGQSSLGYVFAHPKPAPKPALIEAQSVTHMSASSALLHAQINPESFKTSYRFQYETQAAFEANPPGERFAGAAEVPPGGTFLGEGKEGIAAAAEAPGLTPDTTYRYRALAESKCVQSEPEKICQVEGEAKPFRTYPPTPAGLADQRAYELVSPADKQGGQVLPAEPRVASCGSEIECKPGSFAGRFPMQSAPGGDAVAYEGTPFGSEGATLENEYVARRDPQSGWQTVNPTPQLLSSKFGGGYKSFSEDLSEGVLTQEKLNPSLSPQAPSEYENLYAQPTTSPFAISPLMASQPPHRSATEFHLTYTGASTDLSRVFFAANDALTPKTAVAPAALDGGASKYNLYEFHQGQLALVNVKPGNTTTEAGASFGPGSAHAISTDGSRAFFSNEAGKVFVREEAKATREIPGSGTAAKFLAAAVDGSRVLLSNGSLYDLGTKASTDLTSGKGGFLGLVGQSDDLTHAYFVDTAVLTGAEENCREGLGVEVCEAAQAGKDNLYARAAGTTRFVARLASGDNNGGSRELAHDWALAPSDRTAQASPQGRYLAFLSQAPLTGHDNTGPCETDHAGGYIPAPCPEVFLYDSETGKLSCPSCNPSGAATLGWSILRRNRAAGAPDYLPQPHYLFDSGRLYFDSQESLSPLDTNEGVEDVYQLEPEGVGSCEDEGGCLTLISAGTEAVDSNFLTADETGANVFFTTRDRLVLRDKDDLLDLYDAREGGGIPS